MKIKNNKLTVLKGKILKPFRVFVFNLIQKYSVKVIN